ncbi:hypothetical protein XA68_10146 [Ophiocordyceps unilateralis]|uniref:Uncharacterized protein n=1 Tax=Ophiocordyceps unilateralis TaxID=268505 RepID=A0A2A9PIN6_OPHUN|nr:hypothetical protein XA68_10146 [Ophiocordyceps unilateralis]
MKTGSSVILLATLAASALAVPTSQNQHATANDMVRRGNADTSRIAVHQTEAMSKREEQVSTGKTADDIYRPGLVTGLVDGLGGVLGAKALTDSVDTLLARLTDDLTNKDGKNGDVLEQVFGRVNRLLSSRLYSNAEYGRGKHYQGDLDNPDSSAKETLRTVVERLNHPNRGDTKEGLDALVKLAHGLLSHLHHHHANNTTKAKPYATKTDEAKPYATKTDEAKPYATKTDEAKPYGTNTDETKPDEDKTDDAKTDDAKTDDAKTDDEAPTETRMVTRGIELLSKGRHNMTGHGKMVSRADLTRHV